MQRAIRWYRNCNSKNRTKFFNKKNNFFQKNFKNRLQKSRKLANIALPNERRDLNINFKEKELEMANNINFVFSRVSSGDRSRLESFARGNHVNISVVRGNNGSGVWDIVLSTLNQSTANSIRNGLLRQYRGVEVR